jgi:AcrR family transcriptional regulator
MLAGVNIGLMESSGSAAARKRSYHHGDLRNALISAAATLAAEGGPDSVSIRAAARMVGVTPTAAYRHFAGQDELLGAAKDRALAELTDSMTKELAARPKSSDPIRYALGSLAALGRGYLSFARAQPGLFRTVFFWEGAPGEFLDEEDRPPNNPFQLLLSSLDELVAVGYLSQERRRMSEYTAWAMVHGLAVLFDGPLRELPAETRDEAVVQSMVTFAHGLSARGLTPAQENLLTDEMRTLTR